MQLIIVKKINLRIFIYAIWCKVLGKNVIYRNTHGKYYGRLEKKVFKRIGIEHVNPVQFPDLSSHIGEDRADTMARAILKRMITDNLLSKFITSLPPVTGIQEKARLLYYQSIVEEIRSFSEILAIAEYLRAKGYVADIHHPVSVIGCMAFEGGLTPCHNRALPRGCSAAFAWCLVRSSLGLGKQVSRKILSRFVRRSTTSAKNGTTREAGPEQKYKPDNFPVLYFPHKGVDVGTLFSKDHFYDTDPTSPLHPSNILHIELTQPDEMVCAAYGKAGVPFQVLDPFAGQDWRLFLGTLFRTWPGRHIFSRRGLAAWIIAVLSHYRVHRATRTLKKLSSARLALVGYDFLFPKELAFALQAQNIRVVSVQERTNSAMRRHLKIFCDTYFVCGPYSARRLQEDPLNCISRIEITEPLRADLIRRYMENQAENWGFEDIRRTRILVLDYHSDPGPHDTSPLMWSSWENNRLFYLDIIRLAIRHPECEFVIRGKNDHWLSLPFFRDIAAVVDAMPNLSVNRNYEELDVSYRLAASANVIIARYTSLCDEALACGKPVLIYQRLINKGRPLEEWDSYPDLPIVFHDFEDLANRFAEIVRGEPLLNKQQTERLHTEFYGQVDARRRIREVLHEMLRSPLPGHDELSEFSTIRDPVSTCRIA